MFPQGVILSVAARRKYLFSEGATIPPLPRGEGWGEGAWLAADQAGSTLTRPPLAGDLSPRERWAALRRDARHAPAVRRAGGAKNLYQP